ncbi:DUF805 domain-containing protein [Arthrobacter sp.]|uniref:DUF805 domain-containing protein n=1 Tax=Arthrobacter sp. TaxID=1667 RepID=UPI0028A1EF10|nr:DUF805 domain-containing protein [Arthrobacter sp.]
MSQQYAQNPYAPAQPAPGDLSQPLYGANFVESIKRFYKKYATFSGRASRSEFWWFMLFQAIVVTVLYAGLMVAMFSSLDPYTGEPTNYSFMLPMALMMIYGLANLVPGIALTARRLHDGGFSGWLYLIVFVPFFGGLALIVLTLLPSKPEGARFDLGAQQQYAPYPPVGPQA